jgi:hypothetical protein
MKATTKKLIAATFVLVVAIALAASSTYAWFAMSTTTDVRQFDVNVTAGDNLLIAVTKVGHSAPEQASFKAYIASDEIIGGSGVGEFFDTAGVAIADANKLALATADDELAFSLLDDVNLLDGEGAYFAFDVHFIGSAAFDIKLNAATVTSALAEGETNLFPAYAWDNLEYNGITIAKGAEIQAAAANAVRIAFGSSVYEPNADEGYGSFGGANNLAIDYYNNSRGLTEDDAITAPEDTYTTFDETGEVLVTLAGTDTDGLFTGKFTVKIWLEGWDADAFDSIKAQTISTTLQFVGEEVGEEEA